jgi:two-component system, OmpR family, response regulator
MLKVEADTRVIVAMGTTPEADLLVALLNARGFTTEHATTLPSEFGLMGRANTNLLIVDSQSEGFEFQRQLNASRYSGGLLFLGGESTSVADRVRALANGADDFITRPFSPDEFVERVRSILRRTMPRALKNTVSTHGDVVINASTHDVSRNGRPLTLTLTEFRLLEYLIANAPQVLSKRQIVEHIWGYDFDGEYNVVETFVSYLRKKVDAGSTTPLIRTVRGVGYAMAALPTPAITVPGGRSSVQMPSPAPKEPTQQGTSSTTKKNVRYAHVTNNPALI